MSSQRSTFHTFGILPDKLQPPVGVVRAELSPARIVGQYVFTVGLLALGGLLVWFTQWLLPPPLGWFGCAASLLATLAFVILGTRRDYRWIELDGTTIRAKHLYTGRLVERSVADIAHLFSIVTPGHHLETAVANAILGRVKGMEIRFRDGRTPLRVNRADPKMTNAEELLQAVVYRMTEIGDIEPEVVTREGKPLVRCIHWYNESPPPHENNAVTIIVGCCMLMALMAGPLCGGIGVQRQELFDVSRNPPHELTLAALIKNGPGDNRHVTVTNFDPGGLHYEMPQNGSRWSQSWLAIFPANEPATDIQAVLYSKHIGNEAELKQLVQQNRVTGVCSKTLRSSWGATLGPDLVKHSDGRPLNAAWEIEELREPPTEAELRGYYLASYVSYGLTLLLAVIVFARGIWGRG